MHIGGAMKNENKNSPCSENLRRIIQERGIKQGFIAEKAGLSKNQISEILRNRRTIRPYELVAISNVLGIQIQELFK